MPAHQTQWSRLLPRKRKRRRKGRKRGRKRRRRRKRRRTRRKRGWLEGGERDSDTKKEM